MKAGASKGCVNAILMQIVFISVIGLIIALICGFPEILAWMATL